MKKFCLPILLSVFLCASCDDEGSETVNCEEIEWVVSIEESTSETCTEKGSVNFNVLGGITPYEYSVNGVSFQDGSTFDLDAEDYTLTVRDANQCQTKYDFGISLDVSELMFSSSVTSAAGCGGSEGVISVTGSSNVSEVSFNIDGGSYSQSSELTGIGNGEHTIGMIDEAGCESQNTIYVPSGISYATSITTIIDTNCSVTGCHVAGTGLPSFDEFSVVQENADRIKERTQNKSMPPSSSGRTLTDAEIMAIACWVDDDALDN
ncbi:MAG: hypothetical protein OCD76_21775 [Reichenbachiella sp.]